MPRNQTFNPGILVAAANGVQSAGATAKQPVCCSSHKLFIPELVFIKDILQ